MVVVVVVVGTVVEGDKDWLYVKIFEFNTVIKGLNLKIGCLDMLTRMYQIGRRQHYSGEDRERLVTNHLL
jgi:hypothetical protein